MNELTERQEAALIDCLEALDAGGDLEIWLSQHPQHAAVLRPYLALRARMLTMDQPEPPAPAYQAGRQVLLEEIARPGSSRKRWPFSVAFGVRWGRPAEAFSSACRRAASLALGGLGRIESPLARAVAVTALLFVLGGGALGAAATVGFQPAREVLSTLRIIEDGGDEGEPAGGGVGNSGIDEEALPPGTNAESGLDQGRIEDGAADGGAEEERPTEPRPAEDGGDPGISESGSASDVSDVPHSEPEVICFPEELLHLLAEVPLSQVREDGENRVCLPRSVIEGTCVRPDLLDQYPLLRQRLPDWVSICQVVSPTEPIPADPNLICLSAELVELVKNLPHAPAQIVAGKGVCFPRDILDRVCVPARLLEEYPGLIHYLPDGLRVCPEVEPSPKDPPPLSGPDDVAPGSVLEPGATPTPSSEDPAGALTPALSHQP